jgi:CHAT domain-containing protein/TPR repeat protein
MQSRLMNWALISFLGLGFVGITGAESAIAQESISNGNTEADSLLQQGNDAIAVGDYEKAVKFLEKAISLYKATNDLKGEGIALYLLAPLYIRNSEKAIPLFERALFIFQTLGDREKEVLVLSNFSAVYDEKDDDKKSIILNEKALPIARKINDKKLLVLVLNNLSNSYFKVKRYNETIKLALEMLPIYREIQDDYRVIRTLLRLSESYSAISEYNESIVHLKGVISINNKNKDTDNEVRTYVKIGKIYQKLSNIDSVLTYYNKGLEIARKNNSKTEPVVLYEIGLAFFRIKNNERAAEYFEKVIQHRASIESSASFSLSENKEAYIEALGMLGSMYAELGAYEKALPYLEKSTKLVSLTGIDDENFHKIFPMRLSNYIDLSEVLTRLNRFDDSIKTIKQELFTVKIYKSSYYEASLLLKLGNLFYFKKDFKNSRNEYLESLKLSQQNKFLNLESAALSGLGLVSASEGKLEKSVDFFKRSISIDEKVKNYSGLGLNLNNLGDALIQQGKLSEAEIYLQKSVDIFRSLLDNLSDTQRVLRCDTCEQSKPFQQLQIAQVYQGKFEMGLQTSEEGRARAFHKILIDNLLKNRDQSQIGELKSEKLSISQIQNISKQQKATLIQYSIILDRELYIYITQTNGQVSFRKVDLTRLKQPIKELVNAGRDAIGTRGRGDFVANIPENILQEAQAKRDAQRDRNLRELHQILIEPIADLLPKTDTENVVFMPQGELFLVPFPALLDANNQPLITKHTILTAPSIQTLDLTHKTAQARPKGDRPTLVVGNPTMPSISTVIGDKPIQLSDLPGAETEANTIATQLNTKAVTGANAKKDTVVKQMQTAGIIHLATHGLLDSFKGDTPGAIALAPNGTGDRNDGLLTSGEIFDLKLTADLVVLSACDTGRGDITGDGVIGLSRSLFVAGVPSVIVSLWKVPDESTSFLMTEFYKNWKQRNLNKAQALRQAMLTTRSKYPRPIDWAAFTLIGEAD